MLAERAHQDVETRRRTILQYVPSLYQVALIAVLGAIVVVALAPRIDTDFWWHLKTGQYIAAHHVVPSRDFMSFTFAGHLWTDHEWLTELLFYGLYSLAGLWGPVVAFAAIITATFAMVYAVMRLRGVPPVLALFVLAAAFMASSASWGPRVQMLSLFFVALYVLLLLRFEQTRDRRLLAAFPAIMLIWANLHAGFVTGLVILAIYLAGAWLNRLTSYPDHWTGRDLRALGATLAASFLITIINPHTYHLLLYPLTFILPNRYTNLIQESASPNFHMPVMMVFEAMLLLLIAAFLISRRQLNWIHLLLVVAFTHLALSQVRNVPLWSVVVAPLLALYLLSTVPVLRELFPRVHYRRRPVGGRVGPLLNLTLLVLVLTAYVVEGTRYVNATTMRQAVTQNYPTGGVAYLKAHRLPPRVFTDYGWGGYLLWNLFPRYRDFMDSRADTLYNNQILNAYLTMDVAAPGWQATLRRYRVQVVLIPRAAPLAQVLAEDPHWRLRYHDAMSVLYQKRGS